MQNTEKSKKLVVLATYAVAVVCLLLGLFLPLFNGKEVLALKLGDVFKSLLNKPNGDGQYAFALRYDISLFGIAKMHFDFMALVLVLYTAVTALAVLAFVPVALSVRKDGKLAKRCYYGIEITALIVLSLFFVVTLQFNKVCYNLVIAACGVAVALLALSGLDKGKKATVKIVLFILSVVAFLALFDFVALLSKQQAFLNFTTKITSAWAGESSGSSFLTLLYAMKLSDLLALLPAKNKLLIVIGAVAATVVLVNFFIDAVKLATRKDKKAGRLFDIVRYGLEVVLAAATLVMVLVCKVPLGLMLIVLLAVALAQLAIVIIRFIKGLKATDDEVDENENPDEEHDNEEETSDDYFDETEPQPLLDEALLLEDDTDDLAEEPLAEAENAEETEEPDEDVPVEEAAETEEPTPPVPDEDGYVDPELDAQYQQLVGAKHESKEEEPIDDTEDLEDVELYQPENGTTYLVPVNDPDAEEADEPAETEEPVEEPAEEVAEAEAEEPVEEPTEEVAEAEAEEPAEEPVEEVAETEAEEPVEEPAEEVEEVAEAEAEEPVEELAEEPAEEPVEEVAEAEPEVQEAVQNPFREVKPYNPYERHNNPFRAFEQPPAVQPYNPYRQEPKPAQPAYEKPVQPARPAYERVQPRAYEQPAERRPLPPRPPIIQEFKPVPPVTEQPPRDAHVYTIDKIYAGPVDDFIRKLSNDERIEFAQTFIEKNRGNLGSIPDYKVGGDNKKFFSVAFIYLGRIRGMVSDGLLNKMYKEINLL